MPGAATPYPDLNRVLCALVEGVQAALGDTFVGAYLHGSFALGDFDDDSDVDFLIVTHSALGAEAVQALQAMHARLLALNNPWARHLDGSYFPRGTLRQQPPSGSRRCDQQQPRGNAPLWYLDNGCRVLVLADHCNTLLTRGVLRERGVTLAGPGPTTLVAPVPARAAPGDPDGHSRARRGYPGASRRLREPARPDLHGAAVLPYAAQPAYGRARLQARGCRVGESGPWPGVGRID